MSSKRKRKSHLFLSKWFASFWLIVEVNNHPPVVMTTKWIDDWKDSKTYWWFVAMLASVFAMGWFLLEDWNLSDFFCNLQFGVCAKLSLQTSQFWSCLSLLSWCSSSSFHNIIWSLLQLFLIFTKKRMATAHVHLVHIDRVSKDMMITPNWHVIEETKETTLVIVVCKNTTLGW